MLSFFSLFIADHSCQGLRREVSLEKVLTEDGVSHDACPHNAISHEHVLIHSSYVLHCSAHLARSSDDVKLLHSTTNVKSSASRIDLLRRKDRHTL